MRTASLGLSFGYLTQDQRKAADGANELLTLDLFEISLAPGPANRDTRVLEMKSHDGTPSHAEIERMLIEAGIITSTADAANYERIDQIFIGTSENGEHDSEKAIGPPSDYDLRLEAERLGIPCRRARPRPHQGTRRHAPAARCRPGGRAHRDQERAPTRPGRVLRGMSTGRPSRVFPRGGSPLPSMGDRCRRGGAGTPRAVRVSRRPAARTPYPTTVRLSRAR